MDYYGLFPRFKLNRPLNADEKAFQLRQDRPADLAGQTMVPDAKVIEINSNYLELVDKYYSSKGLISFIGAFGFIGFTLTYILLMVFAFPNGGWPSLNKMGYILSISLISIPMALWMFYILKTEWFAWTHYPIRFDRKNRQVHIFRLDGTTRSVPWEKVFFTSGLNHRKGVNQDYYISGHVLAEDKETVLDTFCLPATHSDRRQLERHWEFVRRYMEEGSQSVNRVDFCLPIAGRREGYNFGLLYLLSGFNGAPIFLLPPLFILAFIFSIPRCIAMVTSRVPVWPASIVSLCRTDPDDPWRVDASDNYPHPWREIFIPSHKGKKK